MLYHGTNNGKLRQLQPMRSEHGKPYIYFSRNIVVAAFYTVHRVARPHNWFPYGFDGSLPVYYEYYPDALTDVYGGKRGWIYCCEENEKLQNPTTINGVCVCENPIEPSGVFCIDDMAKWLRGQEEQGKLKIARYDPDRNIAPMIRSEIEQYKLRQTPDCSYSLFLKEKFPDIWRE